MSKEKAKQILANIKKILFEDMPMPHSTEGMSVHKTVDGIEVSVDKLEVGGMAMINGVAAPANTYVFEDGSSIVVDAAGMITAFTPAPVQQPQPAQQAANPPAPQPAPAPAPAPTQVRFSFKEEDKTPEGIDAIFAKFATGTPEERIANLELVAKALMEYSFGWEIRQAKEKADRDAAIAIYTKGLTDATTQVATMRQAMKEVYEFISEFAEIPAGDPPGDDGKKKFSFSRVEKHAKGIERFQKAAQQLAEEGFKTRN